LIMDNGKSIHSLYEDDKRRSASVTVTLVIA
jgi:hypothetical protein